MLNQSRHSRQSDETAQATRLQKFNIGECFSNLSPKFMTKRDEHFRIGEVARLVSVSASSLRNWEKLGLFRPARTEGGYRIYSRDMVVELKKIQHLRKTTRVNIQGIRQLMQRGPDAKPLVSPKNPTPELPSILAGLRRSQNLSLPEVAREIGITTAFLNAIERGYAIPYSILPRLTKFYKTTIFSFFNAEDKYHKLVRPKDRPVLWPRPSVQMELLAFGTTMMEPTVMRIAPRASSGGSYQHEGEELLYMLQGKLEVWLDELERYLLEPGDTLYFKSTQAHRWCNLTNSECVILWINAPITF
jgi:DNA-binding transcriptional MerR regulator/quercetin dioxygenase-like cupin family protein